MLASLILSDIEMDEEECRDDSGAKFLPSEEEIWGPLTRQVRKKWSKQEKKRRMVHKIPEVEIHREGRKGTHNGDSVF